MTPIFAFCGEVGVFKKTSRSAALNFIISALMLPLGAIPTGALYKFAAVQFQPSTRAQADNDPYGNLPSPMAALTL